MIEYVVIDTETSGLNPYVHAITEIAAIDSSGREFQIDVIPHSETEFNQKAMDITGKSALLLKSLESNETEAAKAFADWLKEAPKGWLFVGANPCFDYTFLYQLSLRTSIKIPINKKKIDIQSIAFAEWARGRLRLREFDGVPILSLDELLSVTELSRKSFNHNALEDAKLTEALFKKMINR
jgi:DNA polymerase III epsilon subunit-like protein